MTRRTPDERLPPLFPQCRRGKIARFSHFVAMYRASFQECSPAMSPFLPFSTQRAFDGGPPAMVRFLEKEAIFSLAAR
ncbi:MAG: hypothetical protein LBO79_01840 [Zoogloeaceae bacterium]|jgi:hypothetical protein|nr:hypothetical protein [Zoogloeaceae bacterium]